MEVRHYDRIAYDSNEKFVYGTAVHPVVLKNGLSIGKGTVYPELNFTLPTMTVDQSTMPAILAQYKEMVEDAGKRAVALSVPGLIVEIELLPPMTMHPKWGEQVVKTVKGVLGEIEAKHGLKNAIRITPVDIREDKRSQHMWKGEYWDLLLESFERCAKAGADLLSIESIGGKNLHDEALMNGSIDQAVVALGILGARDMEKLWTAIVKIAEQTGTIAAGDTACAFSNTAMVLAERGFVPKIFAAVDRVISAVRSLVAIECGAVGPHKDCGYEGVYVKAITGIPVSLEGKSSACAHYSPVGNIAACVADLWSNESVQNIKLLAGPAPTVSMEQLAYDCRLMNTASASGAHHAMLLRDWLCESDCAHDPQAYVLAPSVVLDIARKIILEDAPYKRAIMSAKATLEVLKKAVAEGDIHIGERETAWFERMYTQLDGLDENEEACIEKYKADPMLAAFEWHKYE